MKPGDVYLINGRPNLIAWSVESDLCLAPRDFPQYDELRRLLRR